MTDGERLARKKIVRQLKGAPVSEWERILHTGMGYAGRQFDRYQTKLWRESNQSTFGEIFAQMKGWGAEFKEYRFFWSLSRGSGGEDAIRTLLDMREGGTDDKDGHDGER